MLRRSLSFGLGSLPLARRPIAENKYNPAAMEIATKSPTPPNKTGIAPTPIFLIGGAAIGTYTKLIDDLATFVHDFVPEEARILPVISSGGLEQIYYAAHADSIHGGLMSGIVLDVIRRDGLLPDLTERLNYICKLYVEEVHIVSTRNIKSVFDLSGRTVNTGPLNSGTEIIARRMFDLLDIHPAYDNQPTTAALRGLPHGDPEAVIFVAGKPIDALHRLKIEDDLHFLRLPWSIETASRLTDSGFQPTVLRHDDYATIIPPDEKIPTLGSPVYLMTAAAPAKSPKQREVSDFVKLFLQNLSMLQRESNIAKWRDADLPSRMPNFRRAPDVAAWF